MQRCRNASISARFDSQVTHDHVGGGNEIQTDVPEVLSGHEMFTRTQSSLLNTWSHRVLRSACLTLEFTSRHARRYAAVVAFRGDRIGPPLPRGTTPAILLAITCSSAAVTSIRTCPSSRYMNLRLPCADECIYRACHTVNAEELRAAFPLLTAAPE